VIDAKMRPSGARQAYDQSLAIDAEKRKRRGGCASRSAIRSKAEDAQTVDEFARNPAAPRSAAARDPELLRRALR
jgi:hypothetical protein